MKPTLLCFVFLLFILTGGCDVQSFNWAKSAGGTEDDLAMSLAVDESGNLYMVGYFNSEAIDLGTGTLTNSKTGTSDIFIVKYSAGGDVLWASSIGGSSHDEARGVAVDGAGNSYVTGIFRSDSINFGTGALAKAGNWDIFLVKYDPRGTPLWARSAGGRGGDLVGSVAVDDSGHIVVVGSFSNEVVDFGAWEVSGAGAFDIFLVKFDSQGTVLWAKSAGGTGGDYGRGVAVDRSGNIYVSGTYSSPTIDFGTGALTKKGKSDVFVAKYSRDGNALWARSVGGNATDEATGVAVDDGGNSYVGGYFESAVFNFGTGDLANAHSGSYDAFLLKYDPRGRVLWAKRAGGDHFDGVYGVAADNSGNSYLTGFFRSPTITFGGGELINENPDTADIFLVKYGPGGSVLWEKRAGGKGVDIANDVAVGRSGKVYFTGSFSSSAIRFGAGTLTNAKAGSFDIFIAE